MWWKKILAVICLPLGALIALVTIITTVKQLHAHAADHTSYGIGFLIGTVLGALFCVLITFFMLRWALRVLYKTPNEPKA